MTTTTWDATRATWQAEKEAAQKELDATPDEPVFDLQRERLAAFIRTRDRRLALLPPEGSNQ